MTDPEPPAYPQCDQNDCTDRADMWFRIRRPSPRRLVVEFDLSRERPTGPGWQNLCYPHLNGAIYLAESIAQEAV